MKALRIFDLSLTIKDAFDRQYNVLRNRRNEEHTRILKMYRPEAVGKADEESKRYYETELAKLQKKCLDEFAAEYESVVKVQKAKVAARPDRLTLERLHALEGLPVTEQEFKWIAETWGGKGYWTDKILQRIAEQNGVDCRRMFDPDAGRIMEIVNDLKNRFEIYINADDAERDYDSVLYSMHPGQIMRLESLLDEGQNPGYSPKKQAARILHEAANAPNVLRQAEILSKTYRTAPVRVRMEMIKQIQNGEIRLYDDVLREMPFDLDLEARELARQEQAAQKAVDMIKANDSYASILAAISEAGGIRGENKNPFLEDMLKKNFPNNEDVQRHIALYGSMERIAKARSEESEANAGDTDTEGKGET